VPDLLQQEVNRCRMGRLREMPALGIASLVEWIFGLGGHSRGYGYVLPARFAQETVGQFRAGLSISETGGHAQDFELRTAQRQSQGKGVIDVVADIGVDDDFFWMCGTGRRLRPARK